jgi:hypothetical protein
MTARVAHRRPTFDTSGIKAGLPVSADDWAQMGGCANWCSGHGGMLIPWAGLNDDLSDTEDITWHFYVGPKKRAVERVWNLSLLGAETAEITAGGAAAVTVAVPYGAHGLVSNVRLREPLSAKTNTAGETTLRSIAAEGAGHTIYAVSMYEQTRKDLLITGSDDYGVDITTLRPRQPIFDAANRSARGVADAYKNLDARRAGVFHHPWPLSTDTSSGGLATGTASYVDIFPLHIPALGAIVNTGDVTTTFTVAAYAKVSNGSATVRFTSDQAGDTEDLTITGTSFAWVTGSLTVDAEDLTEADGRRDDVWEAINVQTNAGTATTLTVGGISILRATAPI